jgi:hypothetical protein
MKEKLDVNGIIDRSSTKLVCYGVLTGITAKTCDLLRYDTHEYAGYCVEISYNRFFEGKESEEMTEGGG